MTANPNGNGFGTVNPRFSPTAAKLVGASRAYTTVPAITAASTAPRRSRVPLGSNVKAMTSAAATAPASTFTQGKPGLFGAPSQFGSAVLVSWVARMRISTPQMIGSRTNFARYVTGPNLRAGIASTHQIAPATVIEPKAAPRPPGPWPTANSAARDPAYGPWMIGNRSSSNDCRMTTSPEVMNVTPYR